MWALPRATSGANRFVGQRQQRSVGQRRPASAAQRAGSRRAELDHHVTDSWLPRADNRSRQRVTATTPAFDSGGSPGVAALELFRRFDSDRDGILSRPELVGMLAEMGWVHQADRMADAVRGPWLRQPIAVSIVSAAIPPPRSDPLQIVLIRACLYGRACADFTLKSAALIKTKSDRVGGSMLMLPGVCLQVLVALGTTGRPATGIGYADFANLYNAGGRHGEDTISHANSRQQPSPVLWPAPYSVQHTALGDGAAVQYQPNQRVKLVRCVDCHRIGWRPSSSHSSSNI